MNQPPDGITAAPAEVGLSQAVARAGTGPLAAFMLPMFASALLMFWAQPLVGKMLLPLLGGTPMVWTTCMVFFQALLLGGYAYAHVAIGRLGGRPQIALHLVLVAAAVATLPIGLALDRVPPAEGDPLGWLLVALAGAVGAPFFVLAATAPMLQAWFARTRHAAAVDPYFLYVTSNLGSLVGLVAFPLAAELYLTVPEQTWAWSAGYLVFALLIAMTARLAWRDAGATPALGAASERAGPAAAAPTPALRLRWLLLAFAPSSLMLGLTTFVTTDLAAVPMLWIIPLAFYLVTFMVAFARRPLVRHAWAVRAQPVLVLPVLLLLFWSPTTAVWWAIALHLVAFVATALVCHGELARTRPDPAHLTGFYLILALGGVAGGAFNALAAPQLFTSLAEYPLVLALALFLRPGDGTGRRLDDLALPAALALMVGGGIWAAGFSFDGIEGQVANLVSAGLAVAVWAARRRPLRFGLAAAVLLGAGWTVASDSRTAVTAERNFFGLLRVWHDEDRGATFMTHGTTTHGAQRTDPDRRLETATYYPIDGPLAQALDLPSVAREGGRVGVLGLGTGTIACLLYPDQAVTFHEIDPAVVRMARDHGRFTFLADCPPRVEIVLGDGRLTIARAPDAGYDAIILDAFTSDAVPVHLLTREALAVYLAKLGRNGVVVYNISNRYLDLAPVLGAVAADAGLAAFVQAYEKPEDADDLLYDSTWVVMARPGPTADVLAGDSRWTPLAADAARRPWTDAYSNLFSAMRW